MSEDSGGLSPESVHSTVIDVFADSEAPAAGVVNLTSAKTKGANAARKTENPISIAVITGQDEQTQNQMKSTKY